MKRALNDREYFDARIRKTEGGCWIWDGHREKGGYGIFIRGTAKLGTKRVLRAHRVAYELYVGAIPEGHEIHHKCVEPGCVNPDHLEAVTHATNMARIAAKSHCPAGHPYTAENTYYFPDGRSYYCRTCKRERMALARARPRLRA